MVQASVRSRESIKKYLLLLLVFMVTFSGMVPSATPVLANEPDQISLEEPVISKDVDGEDKREVTKGEAYNYNVNVVLPEDLSGYETMTIVDDLDKHLEIQLTQVLVDEEVDESLIADVKDQKVELALTQEQLEPLAGKQVQLQITTEVNEETENVEEIENIAEVVINEVIVMTTDAVNVTLPQLDDTEEDSTEESVKEDDAEKSDDEVAEETAVDDSKEEVIDELDESTEEVVEEDKEKSNVDEKKKKTKSIQPLNVGNFDINITDSYGVSGGDTFDRIYQIDGNDPTVVKGFIQVKGLHSDVVWMNSIAVSKDGLLYATGNTGAEVSRLYEIDETGQATYLEDIRWTVSAAMHGDRYYYILENEQDVLGYIDVKTREKGSTNLKNNTGQPLAGIGADIIVDSEGYLWVTQSDTLVQINPISSEILRVVSVPGLDNVELAVRGLSFLVNGDILAVAGENFESPYFYTINSDGILTGLDRNPNLFSNHFGDLGSAVTPYFDPFPPVLESKKTVDIFEKALGNTDIDNPEDGDTLLYTIQARNTVEKYSILQKLIISDSIPEGLEYVPGTLKVDGEAVTDAEDEDKGKVIGNEVVGELGDIFDTEWHQIEFQVTVSQGQEGKTIENIATVDALNADPEYPKAEVDIYPRLPIPNACAAPVALINGSFESPVNDRKPLLGVVYPEAPHGIGAYFYSKDVPGWETTATDDAIQIHRYEDFTAPVEGLTAAHGRQVAELNAHEPSMLYQDIDTTPGQKIYWRISHLGYMGDQPGVGEDIMNIKIGAPGSSLSVKGTAKTSNLAWKQYSGEYIVPAGQTKTRFGFEAVSSASGSPVAGNIIDNVFLGTETCVSSEKSVSPESEVFFGDELTYTVNVKNSGGDIAANMIFEDNIPVGTDFIPGSIKVDGESIADTHYDKDGNKIVIGLGDIANTNDSPDGITVEFKVKALSSHIGKSVLNKAQIKYENLLANENVEIETNEVETPIVSVDPTLESTKSAKVETKAEGNTDADNPEVGDTIRYTIQTKNTAQNSLVKNLVITDEIPEGLTYVKDSLEVDGKSVTDASDDDAGHIVDGKITGKFGDITDTKDHAVSFLVTVDKGQAGKDIQNIATVTGENVDEPDKPEEEVEIFPRESLLEGKKSAVNAEAGKKTFEVGDTIVYTIEGRNPVSDSLVKNFVITDKLPEGLEFVEGSLSASHDGKATFTDGTVTANFGDVKDTELRTVTFEAIIVSGQSGKTIENIATVEGDDVPPTTPETEIVVDPKDPELESTKSAKLETKADGNTDADNPEVGDTIRYTIQTKNTIEDSLIENLVITDEIPEGLTYVKDSLEVDGKSVTDASDDDAGHIVDGKITGNFGDITDTKDHAVTFLVTVDKGQAGKDIQNIATVTGENVDEPDKPEEEVEIFPRESLLEGKKSAVNAEEGKKTFEVGDTVVYTIEARNTVSDSLVENFVIKDKLPEGLEFVEGSLSASHDGKATFTDGTVTASFGDVTDTELRTVTFEAIIVSGQSGKTIENVATVEGEEVPPTTPSTEIVVDPKDPELESTKSAKLETKAEGNIDADNPEVGDTIRYTIQTKNTIEDSLVENLVITDEIPEGVTYVKGSLEVDGKSVTDASDDDAGHIVDGKITGKFGDITDTKDHAVSFLVTVDKGQAGKDIQNIATVTGENVDEPDKPEEEVEIYPREPVFEGEKSAVNAEEGKKQFEVGDTVVYTIEGRNTVSDSLVKNFVITDKLPEGLEFVEGSLSASHDGKATFTDGAVTANFGDVKDTELRTVTFEAIIVSGQSGKTIENVATVEGKDVPPTNPETEIVVDPKDPQLESTKSAKLETKAEGNTDADNPEVGDTIRYTIQTKNTVKDSLIENLVITDKIPEGLTYVKDSLEVDGESVTDASDDDAGQVVDGQVTGDFGDITDTKNHTITFLVTVDKGQAGKDIQNIATVTGENVDEPDKPEEELIVYPREPVLEGKKSAVNAEAGKKQFEVGDTVVYTIEGRNTVSDSLVKDFVITDKLPEGLEFVEGSLSASHDGKATFTDGTVTANFGDVKDTELRTVTFEAIIVSGQSGKTIENIATVEGDDVPPTTPSTEVNVDPKGPKLTSSKSSILETKADGNTDADNPEVGDTIRYTIQTKNTVKDSLIKNLVITDEIPEGVTYVKDSLEVDGKSVTDASDKDKGHVVDGQVTGNFGDITDTKNHTVTFLVTVDKGQAGQDIKNIAVVSGDNTDPDEPENEVAVYPREPVLEGEKSAGNAEKGKKTFEVGDTVVYTIEARNTVSDSLVENLVITDKLPKGLEFVEGSLSASHDGKATFTDGTVTANFGDVTDTNLRTVTFEAIIASDQSGKTIENIATVSADNVTEPNRPKEEIVVEQEDIVTPPAGKVEPPVKDEQVVVKTPSTNKTEGGKPLPKTATDIFNYMLVGMLILLVGLVVLRRRKSSVK